jgi:hypothetical protein
VKRSGSAVFAAVSRLEAYERYMLVIGWCAALAAWAAIYAAFALPPYSGDGAGAQIAALVLRALLAAGGTFVLLMVVAVDTTADTARRCALQTVVLRAVRKMDPYAMCPAEVAALTKHPSDSATGGRPSVAESCALRELQEHLSDRERGQIRAAVLARLAELDPSGATLRLALSYSAFSGTLGEFARVRQLAATDLHAAEKLAAYLLVALGRDAHGGSDHHPDSALGRLALLPVSDRPARILVALTEMTACQRALLRQMLEHAITRDGLTARHALELWDAVESLDDDEVEAAAQLLGHWGADAVSLAEIASAL